MILKNCVIMRMESTVCFGLAAIRFYGGVEVNRVNDEC